MDRNGEKDSGEIEKGIVDAGFCRPMIVDDVSPPRRAQYRSGFGKKAKHGLLVPKTASQNARAARRKVQ